MKRILTYILLFLTVVVPATAQEYYELSYKNPKGEQFYGFMIFEDDANCSMRIIKVNANSEISDAQDVKYESEDDENGEYTALCPVDGPADAPYMVFTWKEYEQESDIIPAICFSLDDDDFQLPESFVEVGLGDIDAEYLEQFYDKDEEMYQAIMAGKGEIRNQQSTVAAHLGDGSQIYHTMMAALAEEGSDKPSSDDDDETESAPEGKVQKTTLHLVEVVNTKVGDIGSACERDYLNVLNEMKGISKALGITLKVYPVTGDKYSRKAVMNTLNSLQPDRNDVVFFLYSGHGFRWDNQQSRFPCFALNASDYEQISKDNSMEMSDIYNQICSKGARLNVVISDCCNTPIGANIPYREAGTLFSRASNNYSLKRLQELFLNARGSIISAAASPGETSICDMTGGYYTLSFIRALRKEVSAVNNQPVSWNRLINNTINNARQRSEEAGNHQNGLKQISSERL